MVDTRAAHPAVVTLGDALAAATSELTHDDLVALDQEGLLATLQAFEAVRNRLQVVDRELVAACRTAELADRHGQASLTTFLVSALRIESGEAAARVAAAEALRGTTTMTGAPLPAARPVLAAATTSGEVNASHVTIVSRAVERIEQHHATPDQAAEAERQLVQHAILFPPRELRRLAHHLVEHFDPDGTLADDQLHEGRRRLELARRKDGSFRIEGTLTPTVGQRLKAVIDPLTRLQDGPDGPDVRDIAQRTHDALGDVVARLLRSETIPDSGGTPATLLITIDATADARSVAMPGDAPGLPTPGARSEPVLPGVNLTPGPMIPTAGIRLARFGTFADGTPVATRNVLQLTDQAEVVMVLRDQLSGAVLDLGRTRRLASRSQALALHARDGGCTFPGCDRPPSWCERHHIVDWYRGGATDLSNLTLVCSYHHRHFARLGWTCRLDRGGRTLWIPPSYVDPSRTPMINARLLRPRTAEPVTPTSQPAISEIDDPGS